MQDILIISIISMGGVGIILALGLAIAHRRLKVIEDPRVMKVVEVLPGTNCGACGNASCHALAEKVVGGQAPSDGCPVGGAEVSEMIARILGLESKVVHKNVAILHCGAHLLQRTKRARYEGIRTCRAADLVMGGELACGYGCLGFGDCFRECPFEAIEMKDGLPEIDLAKCTGCRRCVVACPRGIISLEVFDKKSLTTVACSSSEKGARVNKICEVGCIACMKCVKVCEFEAITIKDNLARIDYARCRNCGKCVEVCPKGTIRRAERKAGAQGLRGKA